MPPQLEKNHVVPTSWQDEALARDGVSREVPCSTLKGETVPVQAGIERGRRNNNLRYVDDNTLMAESKEELKSLLMRVKQESERAGLKLNVKKKNTRSWHLAPLLHGK